MSPSIWQVQAVGDGSGVTFRVLVEDDRGDMQRLVLLYRQEGQTSWALVELTYDPATGWATGRVEGLSGTFEYFAQAVDAAGNVSVALDHGSPFGAFVEPPQEPAFWLYLPHIDD